MGTWNFGYDKLNRLTSLTPVANIPGDILNQNVCMAYDNFGDRTASAPQAAACPAQESSLPQTVSYGTNNRITGGAYQYDASGDIYSEPGYSFLYDAEGRICAVNNGYGYTGYLYDAEGQRVAKGTLSAWSCNPATNGFTLTQSYVLGPGGEELTTEDGSGNWQRTKPGPPPTGLRRWGGPSVYGAGKLVATYDTEGLHFHLTDPLGTRRMQTNDQGVPEQDCESLPYGDQASCHQDPNAIEATADASPLHFTGKERDSESGNDYFGARFYASTTGRFLSPDPIQLKANRLADPQRLNLYGYAVDNPLRNIDPDGKDSIAVAYQSSYYAGFGRVLGNKYWSLGHAGIVNVNSKGVATYYDKNGTGVHRESLGTFSLDKHGHLSSGSVGTILPRLSREHGEGGEVRSAYLNSNDNSVERMDQLGDQRAKASEKYHGLTANCSEFVGDDLRKGGLPSSTAVRPNGMLDDIEAQPGSIALPNLKDASDKSEQQFVKDLDSQRQKQPNQ